MRVLLQNRSSYQRSIAGDGIQIIKTREYLEKLGVEAEISSDSGLDLTKYDLVHLFNLMPVEEILPLFENARRQKKKVVLSPIYWNPDEFLQQIEAENGLKSWWAKSMALRQKILDQVELILPNSHMELEVLKVQFKQLPAAQIVINGVDSLFSQAKPEPFFHRYHRRDFILSVGRICRRKNQLSLIKAAKALKLPLVLIGPLNDGFYYQECRRAASGAEVKFIDCLSQSELSSAYAAARVHALVSWYDTPGLVSLEAALAGCKIITTIRGSAKEYFGERVYYCNPGSIQSIQKVLGSAWEAPKNPQLKTYVLANYTWEKTAEQTLTGYRRVLGLSMC